MYFSDRPTKRGCVAHLEGMDIFGRVAILIPFDEESKFTGLLRWGNGGIRTDDWAAFLIKQRLRVGGFNEQHGSDREERCLIFWQFENEPKGMCVNREVKKTGLFTWRCCGCKE